MAALAETTIAVTAATMVITMRSEKRMDGSPCEVRVTMRHSLR
jgi:hypothetical protein